jgi:energy-coupling factor transport system permease protein
VSQLTTLSLYQPGNSFLHRLDALTKLIWILVVMGFVFIIFDPIAPFIVFLVTTVLALGSGVIKAYLKGTLLLLPVLSSMIFLQSFWVLTAMPVFSGAQVRPIFHLGLITAYYEGLYYGLVLASRVLAFGSVAILGLLVTHPGDLFASLLRLKVPYTFNFMVLTTLQLVPIMNREAMIIIGAQQARGLKARGLGAILPSFVPLFVSAMERVRLLAHTLEARAFGSRGVKTKLRPVEMTTKDHILMGLAFVFLAAWVGYVAMFGEINNMTTWSVPFWFAMLLVWGSALIFLSVSGYFLVKLI